MASTFNIDIIILMVTMLTSFVLGFEIAENRERKAAQFIHDQHNAIGGWVQENWPTEHAAYNNGHRQGYQQGILQAYDLEQDPE